jgi:hypothetical protein
MTSTKHWPTDRRNASPWRELGLRYFPHNLHLRQQFGCRVHKVSLDGGFTCPNVDGTVAVGGCTFCDNRSFSPSRRIPRRSITDQLDEGIRRLKQRYQTDKFLAYFQPATNTYAPLARLEEVYQQAWSHPNVVGLAIGTRPDCVPEEVLRLLERVAARGYLSVEYGVQTIHDRSLRWMNRGHNYAIVPDAVERSRGRGFLICAHVILGLPGESFADMMATADEMARLRLDAIKIHNLYAVKDTPLADEVAEGKVRLMERDEFVHALVSFLERLPPTMVVERVSGEAPPEYFIGPAWAQDKPALLRTIEAEFTRRDTWQGKSCGIVAG